MILKRIRLMRLVALSAVLTCVAFASCDSGASEATTPGRVVVDDLGNKVAVPAEVTRAVSLAPNLTEIVFSVGAGDRLVGVTTFCDFPKEAKKIRKVGDTLKPNIESIVSLKPQVVFVSTASQLEAFSKVLSDQGISVFVTNPSTLEGVYRGIGKIGEVFGKKKEAETLIKSLTKRIAATKQSLAQDGEPPRVFVQIDKSLYTIGKGSFISDALKKIGLESVTSDIDNPYPKISKERARILDPDVIVISDSPGNDAPNDAMEESKAVRQKRIYRIDADTLSRPGPRIVEALENIAELELEWRSANRKE
ncbi:MAG: ABC transporter substrate-binding protein [Pyrinomonadaceae bacterium]|nr:ABC transporter substrate-binding protein [Pyrinomonadaceae bacterium]